MPGTRPNRSEQIPLLKAAAIRLAERHGETIIEANIPVTEVKLDTLLLWLTPFGPRTNLDVWDESGGGAKVLNLNWGPDESVEVVSFRRGVWEQMLLAKARQLHH